MSVGGATVVTVGEEMSLYITVSNGTGQAEDITLTVTLDEGLSYVSSDPAGTSADTGPPLSEVVTIPLGTVAPATTELAEIVLAGEVAGPPASQVEVQADDGFEIVADDTVAVDVVESDEEIPGALSLSASPPRVLLAKVGDRLEYGLTVANTSDDVLEDVTIVERVAPEVHVIAAPLVKGVDAVQVGRFLAKEDIVWVIDELQPDEKVELPWRGEVQAAGDLAVTLNARATARRTDAVAASAEHYLASPSSPAQQQNPPFTPIRKRVAITTPGAAATPGTLPITGLAGFWSAIGALAVLFGFALWRFGLPSARGRRIPAAVLLLCIVTAACVSSSPSDDPQASDATPEVKGRRIERGNDDNDENDQQDPAEGDDDVSAGNGDDTDDDGTDEDGTPGDGSDGPDGEGGGEAPADESTDDTDTADDGDEPVTPPTTEEDTVTFVTREVTLDELPVRSAASEDARGESFGWDEDSRSFTVKTSSQPPVAPGDNPEDVILDMDVDETSDTIEVRMGLTNAFDAERVHVRGRFVHVITSAGGSTQLVSDPVDVVLSPSGRATAAFEYLLPSGSYSISGSFLAD